MRCFVCYHEDTLSLDLNVSLFSIKKRRGLTKPLKIYANYLYF
jgi:hypothetical protein